MGRYLGALSTDVYGVSLQELRIGKLALSAAQGATSVVDAILDGQTSASDEVTVVKEFLAQPPYPRNLIITPGGTTTDVKAGSITVTGTNIKNEVISEDFAFLEDASTATVGAKAFKTVTSVSIPEQDGAGATFDVGFGDKLGLPFTADENTVIQVVVDGVIETTAPAVVFDVDEIEKNTVDLNSALDGSIVEIIFAL